MSNTDTKALLQFLSTMLEAVESRGAGSGTFRAEVLNELNEVNRDPDFRGAMRPSGKTMIMMSWVWGEPDITQMRMTSKGEEVDFGDFNGG